MMVDDSVQAFVVQLKPRKISARCQPDKFEALLSALHSQTNDCVSWPFGGSGYGYSTVWFDGTTRRVHRLICEAAHGPQPTPKHVAAHSCGNNGCINPRHLRWATQSENMLDREAHGTVPRGYKISEADAAEIRALKGQMSQWQIAKRFGITDSYVSAIHRGVARLRDQQN
jgi:hypothetical protein